MAWLSRAPDPTGRSDDDERLRRARSSIAEAILGEGASTRDEGEPLGTVTLRPHQRDAAARLRALLRLHGGAMLADATGLGKTYVALAVARGTASGRVTVVAPAALRALWLAASERTDVAIAFVSMERLSRRGAVECDADLVIVDESHHFRSTATRRHAALTVLCRRAAVLLLTATPVQNRQADLAAQLALFLGARAFTMSHDALAWHVVRREPALRAGLPALDGPHWIRLDGEDDWLDAILELPDPVAAADGGDAGALVAHGLVHRWMSSRAALVASLRRRLALAAALGDALAAGRHPSRRELAAWRYEDGALQLAFPEIVAAPSGGSAPVLAAVRDHEAALRDLLRRLVGSPDPDAARAAALLRLRDRHPDARIVAFAQYAETVRSLARQLARAPRVAALTATGAWTAGGRLSRREVIAQLGPDQHRTVPEAERIDLLIATDVLSEGLDLHGTSVVVHLDLPWNPARLEQRVGRARRLGSPHPIVFVYAMAPPTAATRLADVERRLREKLAVAGRAIGVAGHILPPLVASSGETRGAASLATRVLQRIARWRDHRTDGARASPAPPTAAVPAPFDGWLAAVRVSGGEATLVADVGGGPTTAPGDLDTAVAAAEGPAAPVLDDALASASRAIRLWCAARGGAALVDLGALAGSRGRRLAAARIAAILARAPRHRRAEIARLAAVARATVRAPLGAGAEHVLEMLARSSSADDAWLRAVACFGELHARGGPPPDGTTPDPVAVIVMQRTHGAR